MKTIEELSRQLWEKYHYVITEEEGGYCEVVDKSDFYVSLKQVYELGAKEAVEREKRRVIGVIDAEIGYQKEIDGDPNELSYFAESDIKLLDRVKRHLLYTPQPENVPDTMLASEDVLKKDWDNPAEDEAWKDLTTGNVCEWEYKRDVFCWITACGKTFPSNETKGSKFCYGCSKPIKVKED